MAYKMDPSKPKGIKNRAIETLSLDIQSFKMDPPTKDRAKKTSESFGNNIPSFTKKAGTIKKKVVSVQPKVRTVTKDIQPTGSINIEADTLKN